jgi:hypothetical protein
MPDAPFFVRKIPTNQQAYFVQKKENSPDSIDLADMVKK